MWTKVTSATKIDDNDDNDRDGSRFVAVVYSGKMSDSVRRVVKVQLYLGDARAPRNA